MSNGKVRMKVNALSDDASTETYINSDFVDQLNLKISTRTRNSKCSQQSS